MKIDGGGGDRKLAAEGDHEGLTEDVLEKRTRKGRLKFLPCRIASGKDKGCTVEYLLPDSVKRNSAFFRFLISILGQLDDDEDVDPQRLAGRKVVVTVKHIQRHGRVYANVVALKVPGEKRGK